MQLGCIFASVLVPGFFRVWIGHRSRASFLLPWCELQRARNGRIPRRAAESDAAKVWANLWIGFLNLAYAAASPFDPYEDTAAQSRVLASLLRRARDLLRDEPDGALSGDEIS